MIREQLKFILMIGTVLGIVIYGNTEGFIRWTSLWIVSAIIGYVFARWSIFGKLNEEVENGKA
jgi:hypothetical protein